VTEVRCALGSFLLLARSRCDCLRVVSKGRSFFIHNFGLGSSSAHLPPGSTAPSVADARGFIILFPVFLIIPTLAARCLSRPQHAVVPWQPEEEWWPDDAWDMYPGFFYMPQICDMGPIILLPFRRKACFGFGRV
jgi:hypothetical protein